MLTDRFTCATGRTPTAVVAALERHGGRVTVSRNNPDRDETIIHVGLPADEYAEKRCRNIIVEWRNAPGLRA